MNKISLFALITLLVTQYSYAKGLYPKEVSSFIEQRNHCDYLRGEFTGEPDIDNARNLPAELDKYCKGTDKQLETLKNKYKNSQAIINKLNDYEESIEPDSNINTTGISFNFSDYLVKNINDKKYSSKKYIANYAGHYFIKTMG